MVKTNLEFVLNDTSRRLAKAHIALKLGFKARELNIDQLNKGLNIYTRMKSYSKPYRKIKLREKGTTVVNMQFTNQMMNSFQPVEINPLHVRLQYNTAESRKKAARNTKLKGQFTGLNRSSRQKLKAIATDLIVGAINV